MKSELPRPDGMFTWPLATQVAGSPPPPPPGVEFHNYRRSVSCFIALKIMLRALLAFKPHPLQLGFLLLRVCACVCACAHGRVHAPVC